LACSPHRVPIYGAARFLFRKRRGPPQRFRSDCRD
jgi:hypothetical protein